LVGAEERLRIKAGVVSADAAKNRDAPSARYATGINSTTLSQNVYGKPGALFSVNRIRRLSSRFELSRVSLIGRAMVWSSRTN
jgi:hypothetical protein